MGLHASLDLSATHVPSRWVLPVDPSLCTQTGHLFGGAALGACLLALERFTERTTVWATGQYLSFAEAAQVLDIDVRVAEAGRRITQARAVGHVGEREVLTVNAALSEPPTEVPRQWAGMPEVPPPGDCLPLGFAWPGQSLVGGFDTRIALGNDATDLDGRPGDGRSALWLGLPDDEEVSVASLAVLGDGLSFGLSQLLGRPIQARGLDNTLRICRLRPTRWVLLDIYALAVDLSLGHGAMHLWAEDGTLLATTSQTCVVRPVGPKE
jgi:acyl-CoA thioesterase-2